MTNLELEKIVISFLLGRDLSGIEVVLEQFSNITLQFTVLSLNMFELHISVPILIRTAKADPWQKGQGRPRPGAECRQNPGEESDPGRSS